MAIEVKRLSIRNDINKSKWVTGILIDDYLPEIGKNLSISAGDFGSEFIVIGGKLVRRPWGRITTIFQNVERITKSKIVTESAVFKYKKIKIKSFESILNIKWQ